MSSHFSSNGSDAFFETLPFDDLASARLRLASSLRCFRNGTDCGWACGSEERPRDVSHLATMHALGRRMAVRYTTAGDERAALKLMGGGAKAEMSAHRYFGIMIIPNSLKERGAYSRWRYFYGSWERIRKVWVRLAHSPRSFPIRQNLRACRDRRREGLRKINLKSTGPEPRTAHHIDSATMAVSIEI